MVLLVEDDQSSRETFARVLRLAGHDVRTAADGFDALEILQTETPDVILCDLHLPRVDGWQLRHAQLQSSRLKDIPFVIISADIDIREHGRKLRAAAILPKPADLDDVVQCAAQYDRTSS